MLSLNTSNFDQLVNLSKVPILIDFNADWCGPCQAQRPALEALEASADGKYQIASVNIDDSPELAERYEVSSIPCLVLFKNGKEVDRRVGLQPKNILKAMLGDS